ncbi:MAG TPA: hypothetical protein ENG82_01610 [Bacteroidetes bacterium]|nr:hypothetical protein [Bacteroidota bacterium]
MKRFLRIVLFLVFAGGFIFQGSAFAQNNLENAFKKVKKGYQTVRYHAVAIDTTAAPRGIKRPDFRGGEDRYRIQRWEVWYEGPDKVRLERLNKRSSRKIILIRKGSQLYIKFGERWVVRPILKEEKSMFLGLPWHLRGAPYLKLIQKNYKIDFKPDGEIIGRRVALLSIQPKYKARMIWKLWIDASTGIILRQLQQVETPFGLKILKARQMTFIEYGGNFPDSLFSVSGRIVKQKREFRRRRRIHFNTEGETFKSLRDLADRAPCSIFAPEPSLNGFAFVRGKLLKRPRMTMIQTHYSDGLIDFSIFQIDARKNVRKRFMKRFMERRPRGRRRPLMEIYPLEKNGFAFLILSHFPGPWVREAAVRLKPLPED